MNLGGLVGNTPLIKLSNKLYAKFETYNPSGSIKDRIGYFILKRAENRGDLQPGDTIVEATSGNTGIAAAMFGESFSASVGTDDDISYDASSDPDN